MVTTVTWNHSSKITTLFKVEEGLIAVDTDLTYNEEKITCDWVEEMGALIQNQITGKSFSECSFQKTSQIVTLQSLHPSIKIQGSHWSWKFLETNWVLEEESLKR